MLPRSLVNTSVHPVCGLPFWASVAKPSRNSRGSSTLRARMPCESTTQSRNPRLCSSMTAERWSIAHHEPGTWGVQPRKTFLAELLLSQVDTATATSGALPVSLSRRSRAVPQHAIAGQPVDRVEVEVAALERRHQGQLVADADALDRVEVLGHDDVGLAARIDRDEQQAARGQPLLAQLLEPEDDRGRLPVVVDARREHRAANLARRDATLGYGRMLDRMI